MMPPCVPSPLTVDSIVTSEMQFSIVAVVPSPYLCMAMPAAYFTEVLMVPVTVRFLMVHAPMLPNNATSLEPVWFTLMVCPFPLNVPA